MINILLSAILFCLGYITWTTFKYKQEIKKNERINKRDYSCRQKKKHKSKGYKKISKNKIPDNSQPKNSKKKTEI